MSNKRSQILIKLIYLVPLLFFQCVYFLLNTYRDNMHTVKTIIDDIVPFNALFVIPYISWYFYIAAILIFFAVADNKGFFRVLLSMLCGMAICYTIFYLFPTSIERPVVATNGNVLNLLVNGVYKNDNPYNCFPSLHVLDAVILTLFFCRYYKGTFLKLLSIIICILISLSTLFTKQHYFLDAAASLLIGVGLYLLFMSNGFWNISLVKRTANFLVPVKFKDINMN